MMKRNIMENLKRWKKRKGRKPLIIQGARQVGKTFIIKEFGEKYYDNTVYLNFELTPSIKEFFSKSLEPRHIISYLTIHSKSDIVVGKTLIIMDEIQECGRALTSLKYFFENAPQYHIIAAGSLLGLRLNQDGGFPVGKVEFLNMYPLTFCEFLSAINEERLRSYLESIVDLNTKIVMHDKLLDLLRRYLFVGGMPEAVYSYSQEGRLDLVRDIQKKVILSYKSDFIKHVPTFDISKVNTLWEFIPRFLGKERKKCSFSDIKKSARLREYERALDWLKKSKLVHLSYAVNTPHLPLKHYTQKNDFKMFLLDVGLLGALSNLDARVIIDGNSLFSQFKGAMTENYVAQELIACSVCELFYWKSKDGRYEVDFLLAGKNSACPLEVKASRTRSTKSLHHYIKKYSPSFSVIVSCDHSNTSCDVYRVPLYLMSTYLKWQDR